MKTEAFTPDMRRIAEEIFVKHGGLIYRVAFEVLNDAWLAEDCVQEVVIRLSQRASERDAVILRNPRSYVAVAARNEAICAFRRRRAELPASNDILAGLAQAAGTYHIDSYFRDEYGLSEETRKCMCALEKRDADIIFLREIYFLTYSEIARLFRERRNTIEQRFHRARIKLKNLYRNSKSDESFDSPPSPIL